MERVHDREQVGEVQRAQAAALLSSLGVELEVEDEKYVSMSTAVSGTGPAYVFMVMEALIDAGVHLALGSDFPVEQADITHGIHAAMTRQDAEGRPPGGWLPDQKLTLEEALKQARVVVHETGNVERLEIENTGGEAVFVQAGDIVIDGSLRSRLQGLTDALIK